MRVAVVVVALLAGSPLAHADSGASFDFGYVRSRVAVTDQTALDAAMGRFAIRFATDRYAPHLHFGGEVEEGWLHGTTSLPAGAVARRSTGTTAASPLEGNTLALKIFAGIHTDLGRFRVSADLGAGVRDTWVSSDAGTDVAGRKDESLLETRSRIDFRLSDRLLIGGTLSADLLETRDVSAALVLALDFAR